MAREFDHGPNGGRLDVVDSGSWSLAGGSSRPFEPGPLLEFIGVSVWSFAS
jgi:hypothetical protein